ncbi:MAG: exodeoxyribonuclease V subunit beta [Chromatiaceae bacterium]|nr:exodeoxyribonuclease V subunit beta [Chromatiaceae bacterium]
MPDNSRPQPQPIDLLRFPLHGNRLIEASAGTGKTYTLALLYVRLVLGHGSNGCAFARPLMPPEILVLTFTDAATKELRERIRLRLVEAAELFERAHENAAQRGEDDALRALCASYVPEHWPQCARRLRQAAEWMDEAMIATIHGWCQRMLQEHAFATRGLFQRELVTDQSDLVAEVLRDYWRIHFYPLPAEQAVCIQAILSSPAALQERLGQWLGRRDAGLSYRGQPLRCDTLAEPLAAQCRWKLEADAIAAECAVIDAERDRLEALAREQWRADRAAIEAHLRELRPHLKGTQHASTRLEDFEQLLAAIAAWAEQGVAAPGKLKNFAQGAFAFKKAAPIQAVHAHPAFAALAAWQSANQAKPALPEPPEPSLEASVLAHAADWVAQELPRRLRTRAEMGFDDLLRELDTALRPASHSAAEPSPGQDRGQAQAQAQAEQLAATIRGQFPVALIDEFQDTDPIQYRIFASIYGAEPGAEPGFDTGAGPSAGPFSEQVVAERTALVMIGDPKQAIYSFRGADIDAYLEARRATAGRHYSLGCNFRSTEAVVNACNRLFSYADSHPRGAFRFRETSESGGQVNAKAAAKMRVENPIPYLEVSAKGRDEQLIIDGEPAPAMTFWRLDSGDAPISSGDYRAQMAEAAASEILRWLQQARQGRCGFETDQGHRPLRPKDIAILVRTGTEAAVMREALAARRINSVYLSDRDSVFETEEAGDLLHWLRACAEPTDEGLVRAALGTNTLGLPLQTLAGLQQDELAWEAEIERFRAYRQTWQRQGVLAMLRQLMHEADLPARLLARGHGERILTNLLHLAEWLQQAAMALDGEQALIRHLSTHLEQRGDEFILRLESDAELVQVITIHKSKGLEYPLVLLPFICSWRSVDGHSKQVTYRMSDASRDASGNASGESATAGQVARAAVSPGVSPPSRYLEVAGHKLFKAAWVAADDERLSEDMRLLYVALTRARHAVMLGMAALKSGNAKQPQLERSAIGYVLGGGASFPSPQAVWEALAQLKGDCDAMTIIPAPAIQSGRLAAVSEAALEPARVPSHAHFTPWWISSYSALSQGAGAPKADALPRTLEEAATDTAAQETTREEGMLREVVPMTLSLVARSAHGAGTNLALPPDPASKSGSEAKSGSASAPAPAPAPASTLNALDVDAGRQDRTHQPGGLLHGFPRGSRYGTFLHGLLEWAAMQQWQHQDGTHYQGYAAAVQASTERRDMLARRCALRGLADWIDPLDRWLQACLTQRLTLSGLSEQPSAAPCLALQDLSGQQIQVEMEFWIESIQVETRVLDALVQAHCRPGEPRPELRAQGFNGMLKGFIDLVFEHQGRYYLLDWKSNWLGPDDSAYTSEAMTAAVLEHRYDLQYALYLLALHRLLRARLPGYDYDRHVGGAIYAFLRGTQAPSQGLYTDKPPRALIDALDQLFAGAPLTKTTHTTQTSEVA